MPVLYLLMHPATILVRNHMWAGAAVIWISKRHPHTPGSVSRRSRGTASQRHRGSVLTNPGADIRVQELQPGRPVKRPRWHKVPVPRRRLGSSESGPRISTCRGNGSSASGSGSMSAVVPDRATRDAVGVVCVAGCGSPSVFGVTVSLVQSAGACRVTMHTSAACRSYSACAERFWRVSAILLSEGQLESLTAGINIGVLQ
jgi:hypothetical protein